MKVYIATFSTILLCLGQAVAQAVISFGPPGPRTVVLKSPEILPDSSVTFRLWAPDAAKVAVQGSWLPYKEIPMTKRDDGGWTLTTSPLAPGRWSYNFLVDGVKATDPGNQNIAFDQPGVHSTVVITGGLPSEVQAHVVPHGTVQAVWLQSATLRTAHRMMVYTPPGYEDRKTRYPVLYIFHGASGDEEDWIQMGVTNVVMDNLIAEGKAKPMIVVMPNGYPDQLAALEWGGRPNEVPPPPPRRAPGTGPPPQDYSKNEEDIVGSIVPSVDARFRTIAKPGARALAGLSMGGGIAVGVGFKRSDVFSYVGSFSSGSFANYPTSPIDSIAAVAPSFLTDPPLTNKNFKLVFLSVGTEDPRIDSTTRVTEQLQQRNIHFVYKTYPGVHD